MKIKSIEFGEDCRVLVTWLDEMKRPSSLAVNLPIEVIGGIATMVSLALSKHMNMETGSDDPKCKHPGCPKTRCLMIRGTRSSS